MKRRIATVTVFCLLAIAAQADFECDFASSPKTRDPMKLLVDVGRHSVPALLEKITQIKNELGYVSVETTTLIYCSNKNSGNIDFELLRGVIIDRLSGKK